MAWDKNLPSGTSTMQDSDDAIRANWTVLDIHDHNGNFGTIQGTSVNLGTNTGYYKIGGYLYQYGYTGGGSVGTVVYPLSFSNPNNIVVITSVRTPSAGYPVFAYHYNVGTSNFSWNVYDHAASPANGTVDWIAVGRWQ